MNGGRVTEMWLYCCITTIRHTFDMKHKTICYTHTIRFNCTLKIEYSDRFKLDRFVNVTFFYCKKYKSYTEPVTIILTI